MPLTDADRDELDRLPYYDIDGARAIVARYRLGTDQATVTIVELGEQIARRVARQIGGSPQEAAAAARAVIIMAGMLGTCLQSGVQPAAILNAAGVAGDAMLTIAGVPAS